MLFLSVSGVNAWRPVTAKTPTTFSEATNAFRKQTALATLKAKSTRLVIQELINATLGKSDTY